jgi:two-component sensor histidine kinase
MCALLETLVTALCPIPQQANRIAVTIKCEGVLLDTSQAVPVGLIVNEAVTNALKHGFPRRRSGEVLIELSECRGTCSLRISDNGVGFEHPLREGSLGIRLMESLARQLGTTVEVKGSSGTSVKLEWRLPKRLQTDARTARPGDSELSAAGQ